MRAPARKNICIFCRSGAGRVPAPEIFSSAGQNFRPCGNYHENYQNSTGKFVQFFCRKTHTNTEIYDTLSMRICYVNLLFCF